MVGFFNCAAGRKSIQDCKVRHRPAPAEVQKIADDSTHEILRSIKAAQRNALMERVWKIGHEEMRRAGLSDTTIASGHLTAAITLWQRELRKRGSESVANQRYLLKQLFDGLFDRCWDALHKS